MKFASLVFLLVPFAVNAADLCVEDNILKCKELGYTESSCPYGGVACQYDTSLWYCAKWTCEDGRLYSAKNKPAGVKCIVTSYKDMDCYDCEQPSGCEDGYVLIDGACKKSYETCSAYNSSYQTTNTGYCGCSKVSGLYNSNKDELTCYSDCKAICDASFKYVTAPENSVLSGTSCTGYVGTSGGACSGTSAKRYTDFTCNDGYVKNSAGTGCTAATCCAGSTSYNSASACKTAMGYPSETGVGYSSAGCTSGGSTCYTCSCSCSSSTYKWNSSNVGQYGKVSGTQCCNGNYQSCVKNSSFPTSISYPANSTPSYTTYTACNGTISEQVVTGWSCNTCYTKSGSSCVASDCTSGYATTAAGCGSTGTSGWTVNTSSSGCSGGSTCYKCVAKSCPSGYATSAAGCGTNGANGWTINSTKSSTYNGQNACYQCVAKTCDSTYQTSAANCGAGGSTGWTLSSTDKCYAGATTKYKCVAKNGCTSGYSTSIQTAANCGAGGSTGWTVEFSGYNGNTKCGKCVSKNGCTSGYSTSIQNATNCGAGGSTGWTVSFSGYSGNTQCGKCTAKNGCSSGYDSSLTSVSSCGAGGSSGWTYTTSGYYGNTACGKCTAKNGCASGYSTSIQSATNCGVGGSTGWTVSFSGYNGNTKCGLCTAKNGCSSGYSTSYTSVSSCGAGGSTGWTFETSGYNGNTVCGKCTAKTCPSGYSTSYSSVSSCGSTGSSGWTFTQSSTYAGQSICGKCTAKSCASGYATNARNCTTTPIGTSCLSFELLTRGQTSYSGDSECFPCACASNDSCEGGEARTPCACGGTHTSLTIAHFCVR